MHAGLVHRASLGHRTAAALIVCCMYFLITNTDTSKHDVYLHEISAHPCC